MNPRRSIVMIYILLLSAFLLQADARGGIRKKHEDPKKKGRVDVNNERKKRVSSRTYSNQGLVTELLLESEEEEVNEDSPEQPHISQEHTIGETEEEQADNMPEIYTGHDPVLYPESSYPGDVMMQDEQVPDQVEGEGGVMMSNPEPIPETFPGVTSSNAYVCMKWQDGAWELAKETCSNPNLSVCKYESHVSSMGERIVSTKLLDGQEKDSCYRRCDPAFGLSEAHCDIVAGEQCLPEIVGCTKCERLDIDGCQAWEE